MQQKRELKILEISEMLQSPMKNTGIAVAKVDHDHLETQLSCKELCNFNAK